MGQTITAVFVYPHMPEEETAKQELAKRVAEVHADIVYHQIENLDCPTQQKKALLQAVINRVGQNQKDASKNLYTLRQEKRRLL